MNFKSDLPTYLVSSLIILILVSPLFLFRSTSQPIQFYGYQAANFVLPYDLGEPDKVYSLPKKLREISGLAMTNDKSIYTINDEEGILYLFDLASGKVVSELRFGKKGDYEALTSHNDLIYIAKSNGKIIVYSTVSNAKIDEFDTPLSTRNDVEGISFDLDRNQLLLACKGELEKGKRTKGKKGIYSFNLATKAFVDEPYLVLDLEKELDELKNVDVDDNGARKSKKDSRIDMFAPSGLAIDPITKYLYVLASRGNILSIVDQNKNILGIYFLNPKLYNQPEGIVFDDKGNLFISNEGNSKKATIISLIRKPE